MRLMTYNIQSGRDAYKKLDLSACEKTIREFSPDILALNEVRMKTLDVGDTEQAKVLAENLDMNFFFAKAIDFNGGEYGIALLSKFPIIRAEGIPVPSLPEEKREKRYEDRVLLKAELDVNGKTVYAFVSHFGLSNAERVSATDLFESEIKKISAPAIFMGDLNMRPDDKLVERIKKYIADLSENESFMTHHTLTLEDRIDYIFASDHFACEKIFSPFSLASDHLPIVAEVDFKA
ncbi:MAG: endonuclease/exonuclease/phosphatase family protein [Clostridia bacterium]|nr:endonuclease/exonuclease/phosphatase family protein [Clostridia bacterium]